MRIFTAADICRAIDALNKNVYYSYANPRTHGEIKIVTAVPYIFEIVIFVLLFELALIVFLNYPFPVFPFR